MERAELARRLGAVRVAAGAVRRTAVTVMAEDRPEAFMAGFARAVAGRGPVFVTDPAWGAGPRAVQFLVLGAKARAVLAGTTNVACDHVRDVAPIVMRHRVLPNFAAEAEGVSADRIVQHLLERVKEERA